MILVIVVILLPPHDTPCSVMTGSILRYSSESLHRAMASSHRPSASRHLSLPIYVYACDEVVIYYILYDNIIIYASSSIN